ncbi:MAG: hypothetical protein U1A27_10820 [Phycisphaerae bacterium]
MNSLLSQAHAARRRLWVNRWLRAGGWSAAIAAGVFALLIVAERLFGLSWPTGWLAVAAGAGAVAAATVCLIARRESLAQAAIELDRAAGLRDRISTGLIVAESADPFAQAVVADAQRKAAALSVRQFVPLRPDRSLALGGLATLAAVLVTWLLPEFDLLGRRQAQAEHTRALQAAREVRTQVAKPVEAVAKLASEGAEAFKDLKELDELQKLAKLDTPSDPADLRREAVKRLDRLGDELKRKQDSERFADLKDTQRRLSELGEPRGEKTATSELVKNLSEGDFKSAQEQVKKLKEQLAKHKRGEVKDADVKKLAKQLDDLAKQIEKAGNDQKKLEKQLQSAGLTPEQAKRALEALAKKDPRQLQKAMQEMEKKLQEKGVDRKQIEKLKRQLQQQQKNCQGGNQNMNKLAGALKNAAKQAQQGNGQQAGQQLDEAAQQLSGMEMVEQEMGELESKASELEQLRDKLSEKEGDQDGQGKNGEKPCPNCKGTGRRADGSPCGHCQGNGQQPGPGGQGRGAGPRAANTMGKVGFQQKRAKVAQREGAIIGKWFVKGEQLKGDTAAPYSDAVNAAIRDATDAVEKDQIPRSYQNAVKAYFDRLGDEMPAKPAAEPAKKP